MTEIATDAVRASLRASTPMQAGMHFHALSGEVAGVDVEQVVVEVDEDLDLVAFERAWHKVLANEPVLCTGMTWANGESMVFTGSSPDLEFNTLDWSACSDVELSVLQEELLQVDRERGFDLACPPLLRINCALLGPGRWWIVWTFHHVLLDGRSFPLVLELVLAAYDGRADTLDPGRRTFDEFASALNSTDLQPEIRQWSSLLEGVDEPTAFRLPQKSTELADASVAGYVSRSLTEAQNAKVLEVAAECGVTLNNIVQAGWSTLLRHYTQQGLVAFGSTRACRHAFPDTGDTLGLLINTVPFVVRFEEGMTVAELFSQVHQSQADLRPVEMVPLSAIQSAWTSGSREIFDSLVMFDGQPLDLQMKERLGRRVADWSFNYHGQTNFPVALIAYGCLLYTSPSPRDRQKSRMPSSA